VDQKVKRGDVLYYLEDNESEDLRSARQELAGLQSDFTKKLFAGTLSDSDITRLRAGNYRSDDEMQAELAAANRRLEAATAEATAAMAALDKLTATSSDTDPGSGGGGMQKPLSIPNPHPEKRWTKKITIMTTPHRLMMAAEAEADLPTAGLRKRSKRPPRGTLMRR
jgi:hypothetical protein